MVALIGDGAFTGGMVYEGMNNIGGLDNLIVILNDNKMSISKNVGALSRYLSHLRTTSRYYDAKENVRSLSGWRACHRPAAEICNPEQQGHGAQGNVSFDHV